MNRDVKMLTEAYDRIQNFEEVICPFCIEGDFDLVGLKIHFIRGYCDVFNNTDIN